MEAKEAVIIDTHCHLDDERYLNDLHEVLQRAKSAGVRGFLIPGANPDDLARARELAHRYPNIFFAAGVHPYEHKKYDEKVLLEYVHDPKCIAIGECGLDYYRLGDSEEAKRDEKKNQERVFRSQIRLAKQLKKPLIVHIREASFDSRKILEEEGASEIGGVLHCYNADEILLALADLGFYFGIGGVLTFSNAKRLIQVLPKIPQEKLLIETDAPYLTPHPFRGQRNEPAFCTYIAQKMAELLKLDYEDVCNLTTRNAKKLFKEFCQLN